MEYWFEILLSKANKKCNAIHYTTSQFIRKGIAWLLRSPHQMQFMVTTEFYDINSSNKSRIKNYITDVK